MAATWPGATTHTRLTDVIENELDAHGQIQWESIMPQRLRRHTKSGTSTLRVWRQTLRMWCTSQPSWGVRTIVAKSRFETEGLWSYMKKTSYKLSSSL